jgi:phosphate transport system protein
MDIPGPHRFEYHAALSRIRVVLGELAGEARQMLTDATAVVAGPTAGRGTADVHAAVERVRDRSAELETELVDLLARQSPVAGDLRLVLAGLRIAAVIERMAELADHIATLADLRAPAAVVPPALRPTISRLGGLCTDLAGLLIDAISSEDPAAPQRVEDADDPIDDMYRRLLAAPSAPDWPHGGQTAVDLALLSRFYERFADQAVSAARQLARIHPVNPSISS